MRLNRTGTDRLAYDQDATLNVLVRGYKVADCWAGRGQPRWDLTGGLGPRLTPKRAGRTHARPCLDGLFGASGALQGSVATRARTLAAGVVVHVRYQQAAHVKLLAMSALRLPPVAGLKQRHGLQRRCGDGLLL